MGPFLAAVAAFALSTGGFLAAFLAFLLFAATMGTLVLLISVMVGASQDVMVRRLRASSRQTQRAASVLLVLVGAGLIYFTIDSDAFQSIFFP